MDWKIFLSNTKKSFANLNKHIPETFDGFNAMGKEAKKNDVREGVRNRDMVLFRCTLCRKQNACRHI